MKKNAGIFGAVAVVLAILGMSSLPRNPSGGGGGGQNTTENAKRSKLPVKPPSSACAEIQKRIDPLLEDSLLATWTPPNSCYPPDSPPAIDQKLNAEHVDFVIATVPNPVSTHLPLSFDRILEIIQQAAQDNDYSYESSWLPWNEPKEYARLPDQRSAEDAEEQQEKQPGVLVFRNPSSLIPASGGEGGLAVFVVSELPTGGINQEEFDNALAWIQQLGGVSVGGELRILGPSFSGSLPSLYKALQFQKTGAFPGKLRFRVFSGSVTSDSLYTWFKEKLREEDLGSFKTAMEGDAIQMDRFCNYIEYQGYYTNSVAFLSEDETAFGGKREDPTKPTKKEPCNSSGGPTYLYYPRDIATLRSAYEQQSIFNSSKQASGANNVATTLRGDLTEPANNEHDTVRSYGGQLTPLAQESVLLAITDTLRSKKIEFVVVRSTNSLDQIFLGQFLRRSLPEARIVMDGADLLFRRGDEGASLRGVMLLSTYPLLTWQQEWTSSEYRPLTWHQSSPLPPLPGKGESYRIFGEDSAEGVYVAARELIPDQSAADKVPPVPIADYAPPAWARSPEDRDWDLRPATWLTVIGHRQFWPVAVINSFTLQPSAAGSILPTNCDLEDTRIAIAGDPNPMARLPVEFWVLLILCLFWALFHLLWCWRGSISPQPAPFRLAYFAPVPRWQHSVLIGLGSVFVGAAAVTVAAGAGLLRWDPSSWNALALSLILLIFLFAYSACVKNYQLPPMTGATPTDPDPILCRVFAAVVSILFLSLFARHQLGLIRELKTANRIPVFWRSVHWLSGVSPLLPKLLLLGGMYCWFWSCLRGLALFGNDRPLLPSTVDLRLPEGEPEERALRYRKHALPNNKGTLCMFSGEEGEHIEDCALPLGGFYFRVFLVVFPITAIICRTVLHDDALRSLGERSVGVFIFFWVTLCIALMLSDAAQCWSTWRRLRTLLGYLDRLPLRRTLNALQGLTWRSVWAMSGNVLADRYCLISRQLEALGHLENQMKEWIPDNVNEAKTRDKLQDKMAAFHKNQIRHFVDWYVGLGDKPIETVEPLREVQEEMASLAGFVLAKVLIPSWRTETDSLIFDSMRTTDKEQEMSKGPRIAPNIPHHILAGEEFLVLPYLGFIQNILGRIRTIVLGSLCLFVATTLAVSSYPFDPLPVLGGIFLAVFVITGTTIVVIYAGMHRDATLSYITDTSPGELGGEFWRQVFTFGVGPLIGLLTTLFPSITDFVVSWLQPSSQVIK